jgi:hypothetical protein
MSEVYDRQQFACCDDRMRLRDLTFNDCPRGVLFNDGVVMTTSYAKRFCLEILTAPEPKTDTRQTLIYFRHFHRDTYELGMLTHHFTTIVFRIIIIEVLYCLPIPIPHLHRIAIIFVILGLVRLIRQELFLFVVVGGGGGGGGGGGVGVTAAAVVVVFVVVVAIRFIIVVILSLFLSLLLCSLLLLLFSQHTTIHLLFRFVYCFFLCVCRTTC